jgi:hypothetical protein
MEIWTMPSGVYAGAAKREKNSSDLCDSPKDFRLWKSKPGPKLPISQEGKKNQADNPRFRTIRLFLTQAAGICRVEKESGKIQA